MAYVVGLLVFSIFTYFTGSLATSSSDPGVFVGLIGFLWVSLPLSHVFEQTKANRVSPPERQLKIPVRVAFSRVSRAIREYTFSYGRSFRFKTRDTKGQEIVADLIYSDEESSLRLERLRVSQRSTVVKRFLRLHVSFDEKDLDSAVVRIRWQQEIEGFNSLAASKVMSEVNRTIFEVLEVSMPVSSRCTRWRPSSALHLVTAILVALYLVSAMMHIGG